DRGEGSPGLCGIPAAASIFYQDRNEAKIGAVANGRLNSYLSCHATKNETFKPAITERDSERRTLEGGHCDLVKYRFIFADIEFRREHEAGTVPQKPSVHVFDLIFSLATHDLTKLKDTGMAFGQ